MKSEALFERAQKTIPGGVNSPVRAFKSVGGIPRFIEKGQGCHVWDADGNEYIDYMMSWGPLILGHAHPAVIEAVRKTAEKGLSFGAATEAEIELAEMVGERFPCAEMVRLVNSGTEATMTAIRLARAFTGREIMIKFDGCYHGHSDALLIKAGSGLATLGIAGSAGVPDNVAKGMISLPYNDLEAVEQVFERRGDNIAGIIVEPAAANMGVVPPLKGFLDGLRHLAAKYNSLLIFDEVISGFRISRGGACGIFGVNPDLVCFGKILGGGLPIGAVGGRKDLMLQLAPSGNVYQAGTLSGNPLSVAAGIATLQELDKPRFYANLHKKTAKLASMLEIVFFEAEIPVVINYLTGLLTVFFGTGEMRNYEDVANCDMERFSIFQQALLKEGIYLPPSGYEAWFISSVHEDEDIEGTVDRVRNVCSLL